MRRSQKRPFKPKFRQRLFVVDRKPKIDDDSSDESPTKNKGIKIETYSSDDDEVAEQMTQAKKLIKVTVKEECHYDKLDNFSPISSYDNKNDQWSMVSFKKSPASHVFSTPKKEGFEDYEITEFSTPTDSLSSQIIRDDEPESPSKTPELKRRIFPSNSDTQDSEYGITQFSTPIPSHSDYTIDHQISLYLTSIELHAVIYYIYSTLEFKRVLVRDVDMMFSLIDVPHNFTPDSLEIGRSLILKNVGIGSKVTVSSWSPLFSVLWTLGSSQRIYYSLFWTACTTAEEFKDQSIDFKPIEPPIVSFSDLINKKIDQDDQRVSVTGIVQRITKAGFYLYSAWGSLRIITLQTFDSQLLPTYQGKEVKLNFLRVYRDLYTMDQFSNIVLL